ncbi:MAG TPA: histidine kinase [Stellaceae bacterium]|nr:histidine kinase [Stellaceae bacterium]
MRVWPGSDLKFRLTLRIVAVSAICLVATSAYVLVDADRIARARIATIAGITADGLALQRSKLDWVRDLPAPFPDLQTIAAPLMAPGLCIAYRPGGGEIVQRFCAGAQDDGEAPSIFSALYRRLFDPGREIVRPVLFRGETVGEATVWVDPATLAAEAWQQVSRLVAVMTVTLLLLCGLVYAALARALRPTVLIRSGLERIAAGDLAARLPPFDLAELSAIRDVFNHLAESLQCTLDERSELTRRLVALQDDERRHLARELHDEFGQCLAAIRALAASAGQTASQACPAVLAECQSIERTAGHMAETLRGALFRLRPPDVDELGLAASLEGLVAGWNGRSRGRTRFEIELHGSFGTLPAAFGANLYRIAQEAMTNAAKHADATRVGLRLAMHERGGAGEVELIVQDDGKAGEPNSAVRPGMGVLGMRERVASLGGRLSFAPAEMGSVLRVVIPVAGGAELAA